MASYRTFVFAWGPICVNLHRFDRRLIKARFFSHSAVVFFGIGSIAWWGTAREPLYFRILPKDGRAHD